MEPALSLKAVTKTFGTATAVDRLDLQVPRGALYGFIGPNGAGKTTSIRLIVSILRADSGELRVLGLPSAAYAKDRIGYLPEERGVYRRMRVQAFLTYIGHLKGVSEKSLPQRVQRGLESVGLGDCGRKRANELSKGMLQRVQFIAATLHEPELLILDEPFTGLDPVSSAQVRALIAAEHRRGATILLSTHVMSHAEELCEHVVMMNRGRKVLDQPMSVIRRQFDPSAIVFEPLDPAADGSRLRSIPGIERVEHAGNAFRILLAEGTDPNVAMQRAVAVLPAVRIERSRLRLEDVFMNLVSSQPVASEPQEQTQHAIGYLSNTDAHA
jgi:ABC-2 type transport system ATP-binding protein